MRIIGFIITSLFSLVIIGITIVTYQHYVYGNIIVLYFWSVLFIYVGNQVRIVLLMPTVYFYLPIFLLNYKFDELIELRISLRWNKENNFDKILVSYDKLTVVIKQLVDRLIKYSQTSVNSPRLYQGFGQVNLKGVK